MNKKNKILERILLTAIMVAIGAFVVNKARAFNNCVPVEVTSIDSSYEFCQRGISSVFPNDNSVGVITNPTLSITFTNPTTKSTGNLRVYEVGAGVVQTIPCSTLGGAGTSFSSPLTLVASKDYYVNYDLFCFANSTSITDSITWNFSTRPPVTLLTSSPLSGETDVCLTQGLTLNFNQPVYSDQNNRGGTIRLSCSGSQPITTVCNSSTFSGSGTNTLFKSFSFAQNTSCNLRISNNCIHNAGNQYWSGTQINFQTNFTPCTAGSCTFPTLSPVDDATNVRIDSDLTLEWNTSWLYETSYDVVSHVEIRRSSDDSVYAQYDLGSFANNTPSLLKVTGVHTNKMTIDPKVDFPASTSFYMNFTGVALDNCPAFVINDDTTWNFTTGSSAPLMLESRIPRNNREEVSIDSYLELRFNNPVFTGTGNLRVYEKTGDVLIDTVTAGSPRIYGIGTNLIRIFPIIGYVYGRYYYVTVDEAFLNAGSVAFPSAAIKEGEWTYRIERMDIEPFWKDWGGKTNPLDPTI